MVKRKRKEGFLARLLVVLRKLPVELFQQIIPEDMDPSQLAGAARNSLPTNFFIQ